MAERNVNVGNTGTTDMAALIQIMQQQMEMQRQSMQQEMEMQRQAMQQQMEIQQQNSTAMQQQMEFQQQNMRGRNDRCMIW